MKAIIKDLSKYPVPTSLLDDKRQATFKLSKDLKSYLSKNDDYKTEDVFKKLKTIYNNKCAFCEGELLDNAKHIEHYRPKNKDERRISCCANTSYFWLAFSWDNLLLACGACNSSKGSCFDIQGTRVDYHEKYINYQLDNLQTIIKELDIIEKPLLVNPEQEDQQFFDKNLIFTTTGKILSRNMRLRYTIRVCNLNRKELIELRLKLINNLRNKIRRRKTDYSLGLIDIKTYVRDIALLHKDLQDELNNNPLFSALYKYADLHFDKFIKMIEK